MLPSTCAKLSLVQEWKCYLLSKDIWSAIWCMLPQFPVHPCSEHGLFVWSYMYVFSPFPRPLHDPFPLAIYSDCLIYYITPTQSILDPSGRRYEISTTGIRSYMDYRIKNYEEVSYYISRGTYRNNFWNTIHVSNLWVLYKVIETDKSNQR